MASVQSDLYWTGDTVTISGIPVADASEREIVDWLAKRRTPAGPVLAFAIHIGGMVSLRKSRDLRTALLSSNLVYADGIAPVLAGRASGGRRLERASTTDIAPALLAEWADTGAPPRIGLVGGPEGLASDAGRRLEQAGLGQVVFQENGYLESWEESLADIRMSKPDILFVGMGAPREMEWCVKYQSELPNCLIMTCGGWFGFLTGRERRAPKWVQRVGGEWLWRLAQHPSRLLQRYVTGSFVLSAVLIRAVLRRARN